MQNPITVSATVSVLPHQAWGYWIDPGHITRWNAASPDWHTPSAAVDLRVRGLWKARMEARDGSMGFDFEAIIEEISEGSYIRYKMADGRGWEVYFAEDPAGTVVKERFEAEQVNPRELQEAGWQSILNNFKRHAEARAGERELRFETMIRATPQKVYDLMIAPESYRAWTAMFNPSSHFEGSWKEGSMIHFIGEDKDGRSGGMVSRIKKNIPYKEIAIEHLGLVVDGKDVLEGEEVDKWVGAIEHYDFEEVAGNTRLLVTLEAQKDFEAYFQDTWPKALAKLKEICET